MKRMLYFERCKKKKKMLQQRWLGDDEEEEEATGFLFNLPDCDCMWWRGSDVSGWWWQLSCVDNQNLSFRSASFSILWKVKMGGVHIVCVCVCVCVYVFVCVCMHACAWRSNWHFSFLSCRGFSNLFNLISVGKKRKEKHDENIRVHNHDELNTQQWIPLCANHESCRSRVLLQMFSCLKILFPPLTKG